MKLLDEKTEPSLYGLGFGNGFLDMTLKGKGRGKEEGHLPAVLHTF